MSYCFDIMERVYRSKIAPKIEDEELAYRFEVLILEMHEANHRLNDGINKDARVSKVASRLDQYVSQEPKP